MYVYRQAGSSPDADAQTLFIQEIAKVPGVASASVSRAVNSEDIQVLARKYDFEIELINSKRECVLDYKTA